MNESQVMRKFGKRLDGPGGRRTAERAPLVMSAAMHTIGASRTVNIFDVSNTGARLSTNLPLALNQEVLLCLSETEAFGTVAWIDGETYGIAFVETLDEAEVARLTELGIFMPSLSFDEQLAVNDWRAYRTP